jgi:hypothetical protein
MAGELRRPFKGEGVCIKSGGVLIVRRQRDLSRGG